MTLAEFGDASGLFLIGMALGMIVYALFRELINWEGD
jgi:hypothetical protein